MLNRRLTGGLAWTGLILILAVPSADIISANMGSGQTASVIDPIQTASFTGGKDPVSDFLTAGKPLPSYISDPEVSAQPKRVIPATGVVTPVAPKAGVTPTPQTSTNSESWQTAALPKSPPTPMPASMRPKMGPATEQPLILDDQEVLSREAAIQPFDPEPRVVTEDELEEWDTGSLADYLERRGLMSEASYDEESSAEYDEDGFFLSDGPDTNRRRPPRNVGDDESFVVFVD